MKKIKKYFETESENISYSDFISDIAADIEWANTYYGYLSDRLKNDIAYVKSIDDDPETWIDPSYSKKKHKLELELSGAIRCGYCRYNRGENQKFSSYCGDGKTEEEALENLKRPNWKLVGKNKKQWQKKSYKIVVEKSKYNYYNNIKYYTSVEWYLKKKI